MLIQIIIDEKKEQCFEIGQKQDLISLNEWSNYPFREYYVFPGISLYQRLEEITADLLADINE